MDVSFIVCWNEQHPDYFIHRLLEGRISEAPVVAMDAIYTRFRSMSCSMKRRKSPKNSVSSRPTIQFQEDTFRRRALRCGIVVLVDRLQVDKVKQHINATCSTEIYLNACIFLKFVSGLQRFSNKEGRI